MSVTITGLTFGYGGSPVLEDVTASAGAGRLTVVVGPNAVGKSTLLRCVIGAGRPRRGTVLVDGHPAHGLAGRELARRVAYVPQRPLVAATFTVREVVELGRFALPHRPPRVDAALTRLELDDVAGWPYPNLSVGQQQRVALARAVAQLEAGGHLVLDEPTSAMDLRHARDCFGLLRSLADDGVTVLVAMHDLTMAAAVADDVWLLAPPGRLVASGVASDVFELQRLEGVFGVGFAWISRPDGRRLLVADSEPEAGGARGR